jgi:hypothetical protein
MANRVLRASFPSELAKLSDLFSVYSGLQVIGTFVHSSSSPCRKLQRNILNDQINEGIRGKKALPSVTCSGKTTALSSALSVIKGTDRSSNRDV